MSKEHESNVSSGGKRKAPVSMRELPREIWVLISAALLIALGYGLVAPILPLFARSFDVDYQQAATLVSVFAFARLIFNPFAGKLITVFGERVCYMSGILIVAASSAAVGVAQNYPQLLIFRGLGGTGSVLFTVSAMGLLFRLAPPKGRALVSSLYGSTFLLGGILGPVLGSLLAGFGLRVPFFIYAAMICGAALVVWIALPSDISVGTRQSRTNGRNSRQGNKGSSQGNSHSATNRSDAAKSVPSEGPMRVSEALKIPIYRAAVTTQVFHTWVNLGLRVSILPLFAASLAPHDHWAAGAVLTIFALGNAAVLVKAGQKADILGRKPVAIAGIITVSTIALAMGWTTSIWVLVVLSAFAGMGSGMLNPPLQAVAGDVTEGRIAGKVLAFQQMAGDLGQIIGPIAAGALADHFGFSWAFAVSGLLLATTLFWWLPLAKPAAKPAS